MIYFFLQPLISPLEKAALEDLAALAGPDFVHAGARADPADNKTQHRRVLIALVIAVLEHPFVEITINRAAIKDFRGGGLQEQAVEFFKLGIGKTRFLRFISEISVVDHVKAHFYMISFQSKKCYRTKALTKGGCHGVTGNTGQGQRIYRD